MAISKKALQVWMDTLHSDADVAIDDGGLILKECGGEAYLEIGGETDPDSNSVTDIITSLRFNEVFVFGSNLAGRHGAGAARQAHMQFGAKLGCGEGMTGQSYAFPTLNQALGKLPHSRLEEARDNLYWTCRQHADKRFLLTKVGCGLAGYNEDYMRLLFQNPPENLILPTDWRSK